MPDVPSPEKYADLHRAQRAAILEFARQPRRHQGRGIVTSVFDLYMPAAWVLFSELKRLEVSLPIEAFHRPGELSPANAKLLRGLGLNLTIRILGDPVKRFAIKPFAIWRSSFQEVLWLDADNYPIRDPAFLFDDPEYRAKGSLFWRDVGGTDRALLWHPVSPVWNMFNVPTNNAEEFETGQLLIDKERCWPELGLTLHFNQSPAYSEAVWGDKDKFRLAWQNLAAARKKAPDASNYLRYPEKVPYGFMPFGPFHMGRANELHKWGGGTVMVQRDRQGAPLFNHRNIDKFSLEGENPFNADITNEAIYHGHIEMLRSLLAEQK
jgi:hypothetical protein